MIRTLSTVAILALFALGALPTGAVTLDESEVGGCAVTLLSPLLAMDGSTDCSSGGPPDSSSQRPGASFDAEALAIHTYDDVYPNPLPIQAWECLVTAPCQECGFGYQYCYPGFTYDHAEVVCHDGYGDPGPDYPSSSGDCMVHPRDYSSYYHQYDPVDIAIEHPIIQFTADFATGYEGGRNGPGPIALSGYAAEGGALVAMVECRSDSGTSTPCSLRSDVPMGKISIGRAVSDWGLDVNWYMDTARFLPAATPASPSYTYGFETGLQGWTPGSRPPETGPPTVVYPVVYDYYLGQWGWGPPSSGFPSDGVVNENGPGTAHSGISAIGIDFPPEGVVRDDDTNWGLFADDGSLRSDEWITSPPVNLDVRTHSVSWWQYFSSQSTGYGYVEISADGAQTWSQLEIFHGQWGGWSPVSVDLSLYRGLTIQLRFHFVSVYYPSASHNAWYVDDVAFTGTDPLNPLA